MITWLSGLRGRGLAFRAGVLGVALLLAFVAIGPIAVHCGGLAGLAAAALAAALCLAGAGVALVVGHRLRQRREPLVALLAGTTIRMVIPLASGLAIHLHGGLLAEAGLLYYLLVFYPFSLAVGTALSLPAKPQHATRREASSSARC
jgi:hypothetical protein